MFSDAIIKVVAAIIYNDAGDILIAQRPLDKSWPGFWEFPGGKIECGETSMVALIRELQEEINIEVDIEVHRAEPFLTLRHRYNEQVVQLEVWQVWQFTGFPVGNEGQTICWVSPSKLSQWPLLPANEVIVEAILNF